MSTVQPMGEGTAPPVIGQQSGFYPQSHPATQPVQVIYIQTTGPTKPRVYDNYASQTSKFLGISRICIGILSIIFQISAIVVDVRESRYGPNTTSVSGAGIWCGAFFILAGSFGIAAASGRTTCLIVTNMVLAIVSVAVFGTTYLGVSAGGLGIAREMDYYHNPYYYQSFYGSGSDSSSAKPLIGLFSVMIILALAECVCDIWSSVICCRAVCCGYSATTPAQQIQYMQAHGQPGQQVMIINNANTAPQPASIPYTAAAGNFPYPVQGATQEAWHGGESHPPAYGADTGEQKHAPPSYNE